MARQVAIQRHIGRCATLSSETLYRLLHSKCSGQRIAIANLCAIYHSVPRSATLMQLSEEQQLIDKLRKIEALYSRPGTEGERIAAERARERILSRLREVEQLDPPVEFRLSLPDEWSRRVMIALLRRYGIVPYRHYGQRRTTVMARVSKKFIDETLWPEYLEINSTLREYLDKVTQRVIAEAIHGDTAEAEERTALIDHS